MSHCFLLALSLTTSRIYQQMIESELQYCLIRSQRFIATGTSSIYIYTSFIVISIT